MKNKKKWMKSFLKGSKNILKDTLKKILIYLRTNIIFEVFLVVNIINGIMLRYFTTGNTLDIKPLFGDLTLILIIGAFSYFIKPKRQIIYLSILTLIFSLTCFVNCVYNGNYKNFASFSMLSTATELTGYTDAVIENILEFKDFLFFIPVFVLIFFHFQLKKKSYYDKVNKVEKAKKRFFTTLALAIISLGIFTIQLTSKDLSRLNKQWDRVSVVEEFGIYIYQANDLLSCIKTKMNTMFGYDEAALEFSEYFANVKRADSNKYTNIFKDKNVLVIHAESFQSFTMNLKFNDKVLTPNMNKLASEGIYFDNFYAEESTGTSSDSEFTFASSLMPASNGTVFMNYFNRDYVTIQKLLKEQGYYTFSMHGNNGSAWNRDVMYEYLGYDYFYSKKDYEIDEQIGLGLSDKSFFRQSLEKIETINKEHDKWYGLLIMLTNHTPFSDIKDHSDYSVNIIDEKNQETEYLESTKMGNYLKSVHYADEAIGELMNSLDEKGLLDDTIVVIYGDHDAKLKTSEFEKLYYNENIDKISIDPEKILKTVDDYTYEINRKVPFIIWSKDKLNSEYVGTFSKTMGMIDVSPTLENMLGLYNQFALGHDIFSIPEEEDNPIVFPTGNWMTNKLYYNVSKKEQHPLMQGVSISDDYINNYSEYAEKVISLSNGIIDYDLIKKLKEGTIQFNPEEEK